MSELKATLERLYALIPHGRKLGLERMQAACARFGNPERAFEVVHVAGTNGKGTVCAFVGVDGAGGRPARRALHLAAPVVASPSASTSTARRSKTTGSCACLNQVMDTAPELTFFEVATVAAFLAFREAEVELAVLEVGLGGRLDATNVIPPPRVAAITRVSFDHMAELGDTPGEDRRREGRHHQARLGRGARQAASRRARSDRAARWPRSGARLVPLGSPEPMPGAPLAYPRIALIGSNLAVAVDDRARARHLARGDGPGRRADELAGPQRALAPQRPGAHAARLRAQPGRRRGVDRTRSIPSVLGEMESRREDRAGVRRASNQELAGDAEAARIRSPATACSSRRR